MNALTAGVTLLGFNEETCDYKIGHVIYVADPAQQVFVLWSHDDTGKAAYLTTESPHSALLQARAASDYQLQALTCEELAVQFQRMLQAHRA